jgi:ATP-dependent protease ClpP protease subunit
VGTLSNRRAGLVDVRAGLVMGVVASAASIPAVACRSRCRRACPGSCSRCC